MSLASPTTTEADRPRDVARWPWPAPVRLIVGAVLGWVAVDAMQRASGPDWRVWLAMAGVALAALGAPRLDDWAGRGITSGIALVTVLGLYLGPPETEAIVGLAVAIGVLWVAEVTGRARLDGLIVLLLSAVIVWAAIWGAVSRPGAVVGGVAMLGLFLVAPLARSIPGPGPGLPAPWDAVALVGLQLVYVVGVARTAALMDELDTAIAVTAAALLALTLAAWVITGGRPR